MLFGNGSILSFVSFILRIVGLLPVPSTVQEEQPATLPCPVILRPVYGETVPCGRRDGQAEGAVVERNGAVFELALALENKPHQRPQHGSTAVSARV